MKKTISTVLIAALIMTCCAACGKGKETASVDLGAFYGEIESGNELPMMMDVEGDALESYYPGLKDYELTQQVIKMAAMTGAVAEFAFVECKSEADAAAVAKIFQARIDAQVDGGAWYPESIEGWKKAKVVTNGSYVALIALGDKTEDIVTAFNAKF